MMYIVTHFVSNMTPRGNFTHRSTTYDHQGTHKVVKIGCMGSSFLFSRKLHQAYQQAVFY